MNIALASQLTTIPVPSPASGFIYKFDASTGTFVRATRSFGPILSDRAETIGRDRIAFSFNEQVFSFDKLDGVSLNSIPAVFRHDDYQSTAGRSDVISTMNSVDASVRQFTGALTYGLLERFDLSLAVPSSAPISRCCRTRQCSGLGPVLSSACTISATTPRPAGTGPRASSFPMERPGDRGLARARQGHAHA